MLELSLRMFISDIRYDLETETRDRNRSDMTEKCPAKIILEIE